MKNARKTFVILPGTQDPLYKIAKKALQKTGATLITLTSMTNLKRTINKIKHLSKKGTVEKVIIAPGTGRTQKVYDQFKKSVKDITYIVMDGWKIKTRKNDIMVLLPGEKTSDLFRNYL